MITETKAIILDRDGVLNHDRSKYIRSPEQLRIIDGVPEAINLLKQAGYKVLVATNQACIAKGIISPSTLTNINNKLYSQIAEGGGKIDAIYHCPHRDEDMCGCRKPKPGLLLQAQKEWKFKPEVTWFIGDTVRDMQAAKGANCLGALVLTGKGEESAPQLPDHRHFKDLLEFVRFLLDQA
ncbi:MAG: D-glycero-beta-D-manno-heptose 1,7-bisphosphate 7-phosphatase [Magnetococcales bacterium]|nr:D-glycero-beta-D-manno-heptose 1,7-bisphosphate 7-phosphatase [Magnetococcales bacterium]